MSKPGQQDVAKCRMRCKQAERLLTRAQAALHEAGDKEGETLAYTLWHLLHALGERVAYLEVTITKEGT